MTSLAKQILKNKRNKQEDDLGIPVEDGNGKDVIQRPQYFVARTLLLEKMDPRYDEMSTSRLHLRHGTIYEGNRTVTEDQYNFHRLTGVNYTVNRRTQILYWMELKKKLPHLNPNVYKISNELWWDKNNGELLEDDNETIRKKASQGDFGESW